MMRCATCKFWSDADETVGWEGTSVGMRQCSAARERWVISDAANDGQEFCPSDDDASEKAWADRRTQALRDAKMYVQDGSEYRAELVTAPDFGCILHSSA